MPYTLKVESAALSDHFWQLTSDYTDTVRYNEFGDPVLLSYAQDWVVTHNNTVPGHTGLYSDVVWTPPAAPAFTNHTEDLISGGQVGIVFPVFKPEWGSLTAYRAYLTGDLTATNTINRSTGATMKIGIYSSNVVDVHTSTARVGVEPVVGAWRFSSAWVPYPCGSPDLVDGREPGVVRQRFAPCDSGYQDYQPTYPASTWDFGGASEQFLFVDGSNSGGGGDTSTLRSWIVAGENSTQQVYLYLYGGLYPNGWEITPIPGITHEDLSWSTRISVTNLKLVIELDFDGSNSVKTGNNPVATDTYGDFIAAAWVGDVDTKSGKKQVYVGVQSALTRNIGSGSGATGGWDSYLYGDLDAKAEFGLDYLPNGNLVLSFDDYSSGSKVKKYTVNKSFGRKPLSNWSTPAVLSADGTGTNGVGRALGQTWKFRVGT